MDDKGIKYETVNVSPEHKYKLKKIAVEMNKSMKELLENWIDGLFIKIFPNKK